jgi:deoxyribodipyrimidine photo-lyase
LNDREIVQGRYVLYWMQQSQRADWNQALELAVREANRLNQGVLVAFGLMDDYPEANMRHYTFMLEGLRETEQTLKKRGVRMVVRRGSPPEVALELGRDASLIVCDRGYLRHQRRWRQSLARKAACRVVQVECDLIVPVEVASSKAEIGARTLRPKIHRHLAEYLQPFSATPVRRSSLGLDVDGMPISDPAALETLKIDRSVSAVSSRFKGGRPKPSADSQSSLKNDSCATTGTTTSRRPTTPRT